MKPHHRRAAGALELYVTPLSDCMPSISHWARHSFTVERNLLFQAYHVMYIRIKEHSYVGRDRNIHSTETVLMPRHISVWHTAQHCYRSYNQWLDVILSRIFHNYVNCSPYWNLKIHVTPKKVLMDRLCVQSFTLSLHISQLLSRKNSGS